MDLCLALIYYDQLCTAWGRTSKSFNVFADLLAELEKEYVIQKAYDLPEEVSYEFADGSSIDIIKGLSHMQDKAVITNGIVAGKNFDCLNIVCNYK